MEGGEPAPRILEQLDVILVEVIHFVALDDERAHRLSGRDGPTPD